MRTRRGGNRASGNRASGNRAGSGSACLVCPAWAVCPPALPDLSSLQARAQAESCPCVPPPAALAVLVVEDNEINAQIAHELLEQAGLEVILAANGQEALDLLDKPASPQLGLVLMDVQMPVMDGLEATRRIRARGFSPVDLPVVAMTAHTDMASRMDGKGVGMNDYLTKPVNPETLYATLEKWLVGGLVRNPVRQVHEEGTPDELPPSGRPDACEPVAGSMPALVPLAAAPAAKLAGPIVNVQSGLATVGDNKKLYFELLQRFVDHYGDSPARLRKMLAGGNLKGAARMAHTVKGVAANLGVERICDLTRTLEEFLPHNLPERSVLESFEVEMGRVRGYVRSMGRCDCPTASGSGHLAEDHRIALLALLDDLPRRMETDWGAVESAMEKFSLLANGTPYAEAVAAILTAAKDFDLSGAGCLADSLHDCLLRDPASKA